VESFAGDHKSEFNGSQVGQIPNCIINEANSFLQIYYKNVAFEGVISYNLIFLHEFYKIVLKLLYFLLYYLDLNGNVVLKLFCR
jgi:hypothetical protein